MNKPFLSFCTITLLLCWGGIQELYAQELYAYNLTKSETSVPTQEANSLIFLLKKLETSHHTNFVYQKELLEKKTFSGNIKENEKLETVLKQVLTPLNFRYKKLKGGGYAILPKRNSDEAPAPKPDNSASESSSIKTIRKPEPLTQFSTPAPLTQAKSISSNVIDKMQEVIPPILVKGKVLDAKGQPLPGTTVMVKGTTNGVMTDAQGYYVIEAKTGDILRFTFIGYKDYEVEVGKKAAIDVVLQEDLTTLDEAVVVGMGVQRKASVVGAISTVSINDIKKPTRSLTNALAGRMAGAVVVQRTGELGNDNGGFWIRGISTFSANRSPLILVDGVERDMQDLSVEEVESVSILKDASATAVYGVRAANGVVLVSTRKGAAQKPVIEFKTEHGISDLPTLPKFLDGADYATLYNEAYGRENYSPEVIEKIRNGSDPYLYPNVNWFNETYKKYSNNSQTTLNVRGGGEVARYFVGFGFMNESGNLRNNPATAYKSNMNLQRYNFRSNVDLTLTKTTVVDLEVGGSLTDLHTPGVGGDIYGTDYSSAGELFYWSFLATPISNPVRIPIGTDVNGNPVYGWGAPTQVGEKNPVERLMGSGFNTEFRNQFMSQISLNQDLKSILNGLKFKFSFSFDAYNLTSIQRRKSSSTYAVQGRDPETGALQFKQNDVGSEFLGYSRSLSSNRAKELKAQFMYDKSLGEKHRVGSMFMYYQRDYINGNASTAILSLPYRRQGIAFRATYAYNDRYFTEFNLGYNG